MHDELTSLREELAAVKAERERLASMVADADCRCHDLMEENERLKAERDSFRDLYNKEVQHNEDMFESEEAIKQTISEFKDAGADAIIVIGTTPNPHVETKQQDAPVGDKEFVAHMESLSPREQQFERFQSWAVNHVWRLHPRDSLLLELIQREEARR